MHWSFLNYIKREFLSDLHYLNMHMHYLCYGQGIIKPHKLAEWLILNLNFPAS